MSYNILDTKDLPQIAGFDIRLDALVEDHPIDWDIPDDETMDIYKKIESGDLLYFCARVTAGREGVELGQAYLGTCLYESLDDFASGEYCTDLIEDAVTDAEATLRSLVDTEVKRGDKAWHDEIYAAYEEWAVDQ